jgi:hypothetical protein
MPRAIDLTPQNLQVTHNPNQMLGVGPGQLQNMLADIADIPAVTIEAIEQFINQFLTYFDEVTGIDLLPLVQDVEAFLNALLSVFGFGTFLGNGSGSGTQLGNLLDLPISFLDTVLSLLGLGSLSTSGSANSFTTFLQGLAPIADIISALGGSGSGASGLITALENIPQGNVVGLVEALASASGQLAQELLDLFFNFITGGAATGHSIGDLQGVITDLLTIFSPLSALNLIDQIPFELLGLLTAGSVTTVQGNQLRNADFSGSGSLSGSTLYSWDGTVYPTASAAATSTPGSAKVTANGSTKPLFSNLVQVQPGQTKVFSIQALWQNLTDNGSGVQLVAQTYSDKLGNTAVGSPVVIAQTGTGHGATPSSWTGAPTGALQATLSGSYVVPAGVQSLRMASQLTSAATAGTVWFGHGNLTSSSLMGNNVMAGISGAASTIGADVQSIVDNILNAITGGSTTGNPISALIQVFTDLMFGLGNPTGLGTGFPFFFIPSSNVVGIQGIVDNLTTIQNTWDTLLRAILPPGVSFVEATLADLGNWLASLANTTFNTKSVSQNNSTTLSNYAVTRPLYQAGDPTMDAVFNISSLNGTTAPTIPITSQQAFHGVMNTLHGGTKKSISWFGYPTGSISSFMVTVNKLDPTTGSLSQVFTSGDISASLAGGATPVRNYYNLPSANWFSTMHGDWYTTEMRVSGPGTYNIVGITGHWLPPNPNVYPQGMAMIRSAVAPILDEIGTGIAAGGSTAMTVTRNLPFSGNDNYALCMAHVSTGQSSGATFSATCGGQTMTQLAAYNYTGNFWLVAFGLYIGPTSPLRGTTTAQAVSLSISAGTDATAMEVYALASTGAGTGTAATTSGSGTAASHTVTTGTSTDIVFQAFGSSLNQTGAAFSAYNQTQDYNAALGSNVNYASAFGHAAGSVSVGFTATLSSSSTWGSLAIPVHGLVPLPPTSITTPVYSNNVAWIGLGGSAGQSSFTPTTDQYTTPGDYVWTIPTWANYVDRVVLGAGGGGSCGDGGGGRVGNGGAAGSFAADTLTVANLPAGTTTLNVHVGTHGSGGTGTIDYNTNGPGTAGTASTCTHTGVATLTGAGGAGGSGFGNSTGHGPGADTFNGQQYFGGTDVTTEKTGSPPGGGGGGGKGGVFGNYDFGANGADGSVWLRAYQ